MALTPKEAIFVREYLVSRNATKAVKAAGYVTKQPAQYGSELLRKPHLQAEIADAEDALAARTGVSNEKVVRELAWIAFADMGEVLDFDGDELKLRPPKSIPKNIRRAIASIKVRRHVEGKGTDKPREVELTEFKLCDKLTAIDKLCKILGIVETDDVETLKKQLEVTQALLAEAMKRRPPTEPAP